MPNWVNNRLELCGAADEIRRFSENCLQVSGSAEGAVQFDFNSILPLPGCRDALSARLAPEELRLTSWGTASNARETVVVPLGAGRMAVHFATAWTMPEPVFRALGPQFPKLVFRIEAIDPDLWAIKGSVKDTEAEFHHVRDFHGVLRRFYLMGTDLPEGPNHAGQSPTDGEGMRLQLLERKYQ